MKGAIVEAAQGWILIGCNLSFGSATQSFQTSATKSVPLKMRTIPWDIKNCPFGCEIPCGCKTMAQSTTPSSEMHAVLFSQCEARQGEKNNLAH